MGIIKIIFFGNRRAYGQNRKSKQPRSKNSSHNRATETPIKSIRREFWFEGLSYKVQLYNSERNRVKIKGEIIEVYMSRMTRENYESLTDGWYRRKAKASFAKTLDRLIPEFEARGHRIVPPRLKLFKMRRAWGRCYYTKGLITINLHLIKTSAECFDYIVLHELCHFVIQSHSKAFYALLADIMPDWKKKDTALKNFAKESRILSY